MYDPHQLPTPDKIHVVVLQKPLWMYGEKLVLDPPMFDSGRKFPIVYEFSVADETAIRYIVQAWRGLTDGEVERCHTPPFGLRFFRDGQIFLEASICWECNNIFLKFPQLNERTAISFNGQSDSAQDLLRWLKYLYGR